MKKILFIVASLIAAMSFTVVAGTSGTAGATASGCITWTEPPVGYNGKNMEADALCQIGGNNDRFQVWAYCYDGYGGARYQYGNISTVGSGVASHTLCYGGAYGAQLVQKGVRALQ